MIANSTNSTEGKCISVNYVNGIVLDSYEKIATSRKLEADLSMMSDKTYFAPTNSNGYHFKVNLNYYDHFSHTTYFLHGISSAGNTSGSKLYYQLYSLNLETNEFKFRGLFEGGSGYYYNYAIHSFCIYDGYIYAVYNYENSLYRAEIDNMSAVSKLSGVVSLASSSSSSYVADDAQLFPYDGKIVVVGLYFGSGESSHIKYYNISDGTLVGLDYGHEIRDKACWQEGQFVYIISDYVSGGGNYECTLSLIKLDLATGKTQTVVSELSAYTSASSYNHKVTLHRIEDNHYKAVVYFYTSGSTETVVVFDATKETLVKEKSYSTPNEALRKYQGYDKYNNAPINSFDSSGDMIVLQAFAGIEYDDSKDTAYLPEVTHNMGRNFVKSYYMTSGTMLYTDASHIVADDYLLKNDGSNQLEIQVDGLYCVVNFTYLSIVEK